MRVRRSLAKAGTSGGEGSVVISGREGPALDWTGQQYDDDPRCEGCKRSLMTRFGGAVADAECPSCEAEFKLLARAGKIEDAEGNVVEFEFPEER